MAPIFVADLMWQSRGPTGTANLSGASWWRQIWKAQLPALLVGADLNSANLRNARMDGTIDGAPTCGACWGVRLTHAT
jgi:uncharacterized protein YjbI with pentapeptide repeats